MFNNPFGRGSSPPQQPFQVPEALQQPPSPQSTPPQPPPEDKGSSKPNEKTSFQGFDPTGFERAAKAAKELNNSKYVTEAVELAKQAEETKQAEYKAATAQMEVRARELELKRATIMEEERRKTLEQEAYLNEQQAKYTDSLERQRYKEQLAAQKYMQEEDRKKNEESMLRIEAQKRATLEAELRNRRQAEKDRVAAETEGRIAEERANHDLHMNKIRLEATENRETVLEGIKIAFAAIGDGMKAYFDDPEKIAKTVGGLTALAIGVYSARAATGVIGRYVEARLGKPSLVRDTSKRTMADFIKRPIHSVREKVRSMRVANDGVDALKNVVLAEQLAGRLKTISKSTANTKKNKAPYRNVLLYGHPGTGKTMFAKGLAQHSGMDYAILTGGDVAPLGREAVTEIHKIFDWASTSNKGLLLFVDEADAFLRKRTGEDGQISEDMRNALNAFLYRTGEATKDFMVVFASNQPEQLDWAVQDRVDDVVEFTLPGLEERRQLLKQYFKRYITPDSADSGIFSSGATPIGLSDFDVDLKLDKYSEMLTTFSGREISKLAVAWQASAYGSDDGNLTEEMMDVVVEIAIAQHGQKIEWR
jgi:ATPase family AAA domain-containing protein 3A/B